MEGLDEALDLAASNDEWYLRIYVYNDNGEILHEAGCYREQLKRIHELEEQRPSRAQDERLSNGRILFANRGRITGKRETDHHR